MSGADSLRASRTTLLADANVLIDYRDARDRAILSLVTERLGPLVVVSTVLDEVRKLETEDCARLGIGIIEATTKQLLRAGRLEAPVSFNDRVCFVVCLDGRWTCVTNDRALRRLCQSTAFPPVSG